MTTSDKAAVTPLGFLAHEIRNVLAGIRSSCELAIEQSDDETAVTRLLADALSMLGKGESIVARALVSAPTTAPVIDLDAAVDAASSFLTPLIPDGIELQMRLESGARVAVDPPALDHILINLVDNAVSATPVGGEIRVQSGLDADRGCAIVSVLNSGPVATEIGVSDRSGTRGMGLAIVSSLVESAGGSFVLEPAPDGGTAAEFTVPVATGTETNSS